MLCAGAESREMAIYLLNFFSSGGRSAILPSSTPDNLRNKYHNLINILDESPCNNNIYKNECSDY